MRKNIITIDGPAASGKGSVCKLISKQLNLFYLETGLYYRVFAYLAHSRTENGNQFSNFILNLDVEDFKKGLKNKKNLYSKNITRLASKLAKLENVRKFIVGMQKKSINATEAGFNGIIMEGRDCGTVIAPKASVKIFLTADIEVRTRRRLAQFKRDGQKVNYQEVYSDLNERDIADKQRKHSPLKKAEDAMLLDNSHFNFDQTINIVKNIIFSRIPTLKNKI